MLINFVRAVILYIVVLITTRLMGKRELGQLQPYEVVISIMIANLATIPMSDIGVPIVSSSNNGIINNAFNYFSIKFKIYKAEKTFMWQA